MPLVSPGHGSHTLVSCPRTGATQGAQRRKARWTLSAGSRAAEAKRHNRTRRPQRIVRAEPASPRPRSPGSRRHAGPPGTGSPGRGMSRGSPRNQPFRKQDDTPAPRLPALLEGEPDKGPLGTGSPGSGTSRGSPRNRPSRKRDVTWVPRETALPETGHHTGPSEPLGQHQPAHLPESPRAP